MNKIFTPLIICALLSACGGGNNDTSPVTAAPAPAPVPAAVLTLSSPTIRTIGNGSAIPLTAKLSTAGTINWKLAPGAPGTLSASTGETVRYLPPASWSGTPAAVTVTASGDGASTALTLAVAPEPGQPGVTWLRWRNETDPTMLQVQDGGTDMAGNAYVLLQVRVTPSRKGPVNLAKIAPDGTITSLIGTTWFGQPAENGKDISATSGVTADRAGNVYLGIPLYGLGNYPGPLILKVTPSGAWSVLAGGGATTAIKDGTGSEAQFLYPGIAGIDNEDNIYVLDGNTPRKVTPAGVVTTLPALPASLNADMDGNTYRISEDKLLRISPDGKADEVTGVLYCKDRPAGSTAGCLGTDARKVLPLSGASLVVFGEAVYRVVLKH
ncbi:hypothetical protein GJV26_07130 [Massilia dura]|uniref:Uncharacterized protein n=1 Tax=Pseudoduganella dura TaxID=321982 RepID=A0A6I3XCH8_9BURK|nr:hypothetical protein [Pseudoduganella dura]MUI12250.1 hypothetical protein [Pseudoduganella dura]GGY06296.1 hypothetical protein GCM10007386_41270 [Pseudoduganella dura]